MRTKLVLAAALLGAGGLVLPATSASASCVYLTEEGTCIGFPCPDEAWNKAAAQANAVLDQAGVPVRVNDMACIT